MSAAVVIRAAHPGDETVWRRLWRSCRAAQGVMPAEEAGGRTWTRILDPDSAVMCLVAEVDGQVYGIAHCVVHESTWEPQPACLLEAVYVEPAARGHGIGTALLEWLRSALPAEGWGRVYWLAPEGDSAGQRFFGRFARAERGARWVMSRA